MTVEVLVAWLVPTPVGVCVTVLLAVLVAVLVGAEAVVIHRLDVQGVVIGAEARRVTRAGREGGAEEIDVQLAMIR